MLQSGAHSAYAESNAAGRCRKSATSTSEGISGEHQPTVGPSEAAEDSASHDQVRSTFLLMRPTRICLGSAKINFSQVFAGQAVGIKEVHDDIWLVSFMDYDLGYFDLEARVLEPLDNPFGPKVLPMS